VEDVMKYLKPNEIVKVLSEAKRHGNRSHLMFLLGFKLGLRVSEIASIKLADISTGRISVKRAKGSEDVQDRELASHDNPLLDEKRVLAAWLRERGEDASEYLFPSREADVVSERQIQRLFTRCAIRAGIDEKRAHIHTLKHSLGRMLAEQKVELYFIQKVLGHKYLSSTQIYLSITADEAAVESNKVLASVFA
jgi:site-specific recombinase XerD